MSPKELELSGSQMTFGEHLEELRTRVFKAILGSIIGLVLCFIFHRSLLNLVTKPYRQVMEELGQSTALKAFGPSSAFLGYIKVSFIAGLILTAPWWMYQIWAFVAAGLYHREKRHVYRYAPLCLILFAAGVSFGYTTLIPIGLRYLLTFGDPAVVQNWVGLSEYLKLFSILTLILGLAFQLPVAMLALAKAGVCSTQSFRAKRKMVILSMFIVGAIFTPPDPATQLLLATPLCGLYELGIVLVWVGGGGKLPPLNLPVLRRRALKGAVVVAVIALAWTPLAGIWAGQRADSMVVTKGADDDVALKAMGVFLHTEIDSAFRVSSESGRNVWVVLAAGKLQVLTEQSERDELVVLARDMDSAGATMRYMRSASGTVTYTLERPDRIAYRDFVPALLEGLEFGSEETRAQSWSFLSVLIGNTPEGSSAEHLDHARRWFAANAQGEHTQPK